MSLITSDLLSAVPGIVHGFGESAELVPAALAPYWAARPLKIQIHSASVAQVALPGQQCGQADAFITEVPGLPVSVITADCVPVLLARRDGKKVAAVHAGWRGLIAGILPNTLRRAADQGDRASDWVAAIGPAICGQCYEVSEELAAQFVAHFSALPAGLVRPSARHLDLTAIAEAQLRALGVSEVDRLPWCTSCSRDSAQNRLFRSYRQGDRRSHQHAGVCIAG